MKHIKLLVVGIFILNFLSCTKEAPKATNETLDKGHDQWQKVVFRFTEGKTINENGNTYFETLKNPQALSLKLPFEQEYTYKYTKDGVIAENSQPILLVQGKSYSLEIFYYNKQDKLMNYEFTTAEMAPIHQHFFIPEDIKSIKVGVEKADKSNVISYFYRDTKPYNKMLGESGVSLREKNDPIGLKGYFKVNKAYQSFDLKIVLVHVTRGSKLDDNGNPYPFYQPSPRVLGVTDLSLKVPIKVFSSYQSSEYKEDISKTYHIPLDEVPSEISKRNETFEKGEKIKI